MSASTAPSAFPSARSNAIYAEEDAPKDQQHMIALNAELARLPGWKSITKRKAALPDAERLERQDRQAVAR